MNKEHCVFCNYELGELNNHNPYPASETGRCCDMCNILVVLPARMAVITEFEKREREEV